MHFDCLSLNTLRRMKEDALDISSDPKATPERVAEALAIVDEVDATLDRNIAFVQAVQEVLLRG